MQRSPITSAHICRWKARALGQGEGSSYKPWIDVRSFSTKGRASRAPGLTAGRPHHVFSDNEDHFCLMADYAWNVVDIREQFPLFPEESTQKIAGDLHIRHPRYPNSKTMLIMTTDFLLTMADDTKHLTFAAFSIKSSKDLSGKKRRRILEKLELERRYWLLRGIPWTLVTDEEINNSVIQNLDWLNYLTVESNIDRSLLNTRVSAFIAAFRIASQQGGPLKHVLQSCAELLGDISEEFVYQLFRHCAWNHIIELDLSRPVGPLYELNVLSIHNPDIAQHSGDGELHVR
jgi:hypothetical protein